MEMEVAQPKTIAVENVLIAHHFLKDVVVHTPLQLNDYLSEKYGAKIYFKREDLQHVRSFKLRGAYYKIKKIEDEARASGVVCASAGNHAQGVAYACAKLEIKATIFMPKTTPKQKLIRCACLDVALLKSSSLAIHLTILLKVQLLIAKKIIRFSFTHLMIMT